MPEPGPDQRIALLRRAVQGRSYVGRSGIPDFFRDLVGSFNVEYVDPEFRSIGDDAVLLLTSMRLRGKESGIGMDQELGVVCEYDGGLLRRGHAYETPAAAIAAADTIDA